MMTSSGTSLPESMYDLADLPASVPALTAARSMSPVEMCVSPKFCAAPRTMKKRIGREKGLLAGRQRSLNDGQIPNVRVVRIALGTGCNRVERGSSRI
jgi:hypothetical protein